MHGFPNIKLYLSFVSLYSLQKYTKKYFHSVAKASKVVHTCNWFKVNDTKDLPTNGGRFVLKRKEKKQRWSLFFSSCLRSCAANFIQSSRPTCGMATRNHLDLPYRSLLIHCLWNVDHIHLHFLSQTMADIWSLQGPFARGPGSLYL